MSEAELAQRIQALERRVARLEGTEFATDPSEVPTDEIVALLQQGKAIHAIKHYRELTGANLADAKAAVERIEATYLPGG